MGGEFPWALVLAGLSAFFGALTGVASLGFWLATKFNNVYQRIAEHEICDERRFGDLKLLISDVTIQAQASQLQHRH